MRWIVTALGRSVPGEPRRFVLKMDSWHVLDLPVIRRAFPGVPSIMLYRHPVEVLVSHERIPGWMMVPRHSERLLGLTLDEAVKLPQEDYRTRILERFLGTMLCDDDSVCRLVNYVELPGAAMGPIPLWFGMDLGSRDRRMMAEASRRDTKQPYRQHTPDSEEKQRGARAAIPDRRRGEASAPLSSAGGSAAAAAAGPPQRPPAESGDDDPVSSSSSHVDKLPSRVKLPFALGVIYLTKRVPGCILVVWTRSRFLARYSKPSATLPTRR